MEDELRKAFERRILDSFGGNQSARIMGIYDWAKNEVVVESYKYRDDSAYLICVLCGMIASGGGSYPSSCAANAGGRHVRPGSPGAQRAKEIHAAWLRNPFAEVDK